jgi:hypothetical protein
MLPVRGLRSQSAQIAAYGRAKLDDSPVDRLGGDVEARLGQQFFNISETEGKRRLNQTVCRMISGGNRWWQEEIGCILLPYRATA